MMKPVLAVITAALVVGVGVAIATPPNPDNTAGRSNDILGLVPTLQNARAQAAGAGGGGNLTYHGGPVLLTNKTVPIYWGPSSRFPDASYASNINRYLADVAADSSKTTNVYAVETQYTNGSGQAIAYQSTAGAAIYDTSAYPASGCTDSVAATDVCLSDSQIRAEIAKLIPNPDPTTVYFVFTGKGVGSCYSGSSCAFSTYCAYHSNGSTSGKSYLYANQPYADTVSSACDAGYHPNGGDADATINVASHEHREAINDPFGNAWYDRRGYEGSDKCAWNFGTLTGPNYNQTINGHNYILQQEWSNKNSGCRLRYP